jgi:hypothetical protein
MNALFNKMFCLEFLFLGIFVLYYLAAGKPLGAWGEYPMVFFILALVIIDTIFMISEVLTFKLLGDLMKRYRLAWGIGLIAAYIYIFSQEAMRSDYTMIGSCVIMLSYVILRGAREFYMCCYGTRDKFNLRRR